MKFYIGLHHPSDAKHFDRSMVSINTLRKRKSDFHVNEWLMDSGAFTEVARHGGYREGVGEYGTQIRRWRQCGQLAAAVAQDWMCEPFVLKATGKTVDEHLRLTVERYDALIQEDVGAYVMPVLQGYHPEDYLRCLDLYGHRLIYGQWVGVGSVCKRNGSPRSVEAVLMTIKGQRPDLRLHGFGLKITALASAVNFDSLHSADSMAWSFAARKAGRNANDWREAKRYITKLESQAIQGSLFY
jgi:hypothetical protein